LNILSTDPFVPGGGNPTPEVRINEADFGNIASKGDQVRNFQAQLRFQF
jgi:hypothetical protein